MSGLKCKAYSIIRGGGGETLVESIVSLFILSILLVTVTTMISIALRTSGNSIDHATKMQQETVNPIILSEADSAGNDTITFGLVSGEIIETHEIALADSQLFAFEPVQGD